jgi:hypothetical protein
MKRIDNLPYFLQRKRMHKEMRGFIFLIIVYTVLFIIVVIFDPGMACKSALEIFVIFFGGLFFVVLFGILTS